VPVYTHQQVGWALRWGPGAGAAAALAIAWSDPAARPGGTAAAVLFVLIAALFSSLTVEVDHEGVLAWFGPLRGILWRRLPAAEIRSVQVVRNRWYYGWGFRRVPSGWMFNVSGLDAVEFELTGSRRFRIGTDDPQGLQRAVQEMTSVAR